MGLPDLLELVSGPGTPVADTHALLRSAEANFGRSSIEAFRKTCYRQGGLYAVSLLPGRLLAKVSRVTKLGM